MCMCVFGLVDAGGKKARRRRLGLKFTMEELEDCIDYSIVDSNGDVYIHRIKRSEKHKYDLDHHLVFRTLNELKKKQAPVVSNRMEGSSVNAPPPKAKNGFKWTADNVNKLLGECLDRRETLRAGQVPLTFWKEVSSVLNVLDCPANPEQCREKYRNLKGTYSNVKAGVAGVKRQWPHGLLMRRILDDDISHVTCTKPAGLVEVEGTVRNINISPSSNDSDTPQFQEAENMHDSALGEATFDVNIGIVSTPNVKNSPPKKKSSSGVMFRSPTNKTPKRKIAAVKLIWDSQTTDSFVAACLTRKDYLQKDDVPTKVWKDIKSEMSQLGHNEIWECYRAKFNQMNNFFANSVLATGGLINGIMWPYYHNFCSIHDIPVDFTIADGDETSEMILTPSKKRRIWVDEAEKLLIQLYSDRKEKFDGTKSSIRHSTLYNDISSIMRANLVNVTAKQCKAHMNELLSEFRKAYDNSRRTGAGAIEFRHYDMMMKIFEGSATLVTPYATSVGRGLKYTISGEENTEYHTGTRTRPKSSAASTSKENCSGGKPRKKLFKSYGQELMERQVALREEQNEEFRLMRIGFEKKSEERSQMIQQLVQLACLQMQVGMGQKTTFDQVQSLQKQALQPLQNEQNRPRIE